MKLLKENVRQSTLTQWSSDGQEWPLWAGELSIKREQGRRISRRWNSLSTDSERGNRSGGGGTERSRWWEEWTGRMWIKEGRERKTEIFQAVDTSWDLIPNTVRGYGSTASEEQSVLFLMFWGPSILFPVAAAPFCNPTNSVKSSSFSTSSPMLVCCCS